MHLIPILLALALLPGLATEAAAQASRPNILLVITDDQSYPHASAYGSRFVETPTFDRVAREGVLFTRAYVASPGCSPSRAALLTGRYPWQIEQAGTHASSFPAKYVVIPDLLEQTGYRVGYTGKGWGPGDWESSGRPRNPAGPAFNDARLPAPVDGMSAVDYAANFREFLRQRPGGAPFFFWYGASEPHRRYAPGSGRAAGKRLEEVEVPAYLPDTPEVRSDLLDYALEIEHADRQLGRMLELLEEMGELDNTLVIVTADNGMPFPRAKATVYDAGIHVPLAVRWPARIPGGRVVEDLVSLIDLTPTLLEAAGVEHPGTHPMSGRSVLGLLASRASGIVEPTRDAVFAGRERHSSARWNNLGYPQRAIRTRDHLYIRNFAPERWPAGAPRRYEEDGTLGPMHGGYADIDPGPTLDLLTSGAGDPHLDSYLYLAVARQPAEELYDLRTDPDCLHNLAADPAYAVVTREHRERLEARLRETGDPRVLGNGDVWESYERLEGPMRRFPTPEWALP
ncbi:MAG TPA: sulfatase [Longimicrobiaceae bacterium]